MSGFPPIPVYPVGYDSDFTLFQVYNTSETLTVSDTDAFSEEIPIRPQSIDKPEIWAENGYATISGELFYYDAVDYNSDERVCRLRRCVRNLGGKQSQFNAAGTWVRGFVVAEHHNQLVDCILLTENFIGENFSIDPTTLDWRIRNLAAAQLISDDSTCANIEFDFNVLSSNPITGTLVSYNVNLEGNASFLLQFGDGQSTTSAKSGTHTYAPGANIDPVVILQNDDCQTIQTINIRNNPNTPEVKIVKVPFITPVPIPPPIPPVVIPSIVIEPPVLNLPPVVIPCIPPFSFPSVIGPINIPSTIEITPISLPSVITITPVSIPSQIIGPDINVPSTITINQPTFPEFIPIGPAPPIPPIQIQPPLIPPVQMEIGQVQSDIPSIIEIVGPNLPSIISVVMASNDVQVSLIHNLQDINLVHSLPKELKVESIPDLKLDVDSVKRVMKEFTQSFSETMTQFKINMPDFSQMKMPKLSIDWGEIPTLTHILKLARPKIGQSIDTHGGAGKPEEVEFEHIDFPTQIPLTLEEIPTIKVEHNIPKFISLESNLRDIKLDASSVPTEIRLLPPKDDMRISVVPFEVPNIKFDTSALEGLVLPIKMPTEMPSIQVQFPDQMPTLKVEFPTQMPTIKIEVPDNTRIPLFYDGPPLPVQLNLKIQDLAGEAADDVQCFRILPCKR